MPNARGWESAPQGRLWGATTSAAVGSGAAIEGVVMVMVVWVACSRPLMPLGWVQGNVTIFFMECELFSSLQLEQQPSNYLRFAHAPARKVQKEQRLAFGCAVLKRTGFIFHNTKSLFVLNRIGLNKHHIKIVK
jgi:hypothetical protein